VNQEDSDYVPHPALKKAAAKISGPVRVKVAAKCKVEEPKDEATVTTKTRIKGPKRLNGNNVRMSDLPEFAAAKWRDAFLPTLYDKLFTSDQPFDAFAKGSDQFVALLQAVVEEVYPDIKYKVTSSGGIHFLVCIYTVILHSISRHWYIFLSRHITESMKKDPA
jgi:hypothetical protein